jgi:hypothetical protein
LLLEYRRVSALHLFRYHLFNFAAKQPFVAKRVPHGSGPFAVELIFQRPNGCGARTYRSLERAIHICDVKVN